MLATSKCKLDLFRVMESMEISAASSSTLSALPVTRVKPDNSLLRATNQRWRWVLDSGSVDTDNRLVLGLRAVIRWFRDRIRSDEDKPEIGRISEELQAAHPAAHPEGVLYPQK